MTAPLAGTALPARDEALLRLGRLLQARDYRFVTVTPATHARVNARPENRMARGLADVFGWSRPFRREVLDAEVFAALEAADALEAHGDGWRSRVRWSSLDDGLLVHSRYPTDATDAVFFGPDTYRFVQAIDRHLEGVVPGSIRRAADIGCGAGPGALRVARACPQAEVLALDINPRALALTRVNAALAGAERLSARHSDLLKDVEGDFDLIVSNPPYLLDPGERAYRHGGGGLGLGLSLAIVDAALERLAPGGALLLYTGVAMVEGRDPFLGRLRQRLADSPVNWHYREMDPDVFGEELLEPAYAGADRIAAVVLDLRRA
ncbi:class I SAM-dependent methyltransferase [Pseudomonas sp. RIT-PI-AD]|uniref:class I SAM-dependent methyltransferase n=1 Tax=Pseudomonas sp. RIT-PI-AD TaxID=3035294 RepID=UPI0021D9DDC7|nr:class I SAM-dependent methyltransferase [Pseudomonas sp. RIT-PI-AD]